jgi:hypothetical protein
VRWATAGAALLLLWLGAGCASWPPAQQEVFVARGAPPNAVTGKTVAVEEFVLDTEVTRYDGPDEWLGVELAQDIAYELRHAGIQATPVLRDSGEADIRVRGRILVADGGSKAARMWAPGAGGARLQIAGEAVGADGQLLGRFSRERRSSRHPDSVILMELCIDALARDVAGMITQDEYREHTP